MPSYGQKCEESIGCIVNAGEINGREDPCFTGSSIEVVENGA